MIDHLDRLLTWLFATRLAKWVAVHLLHIPPEKCSMCYTRVRWAQLMLYLTQHLDGIEWLHDKRVLWRVKANPLPTNWSLSSMRRVGSSSMPSADGAMATPFPHEPFQLSDQPLLETVLSLVELALLREDDPPHWPPWWAPAVCALAEQYYALALLGSRRQYAEW